MVSITGIILLAFPISVIVEHFHEEYTPNAGGEGQEDDPLRALTQPNMAMPIAQSNFSMQPINAALMAAAQSSSSALLPAGVTNGMLLFELKPLLTSPDALEQKQ